jgi:hypothetical protein
VDQRKFAAKFDRLAAGQMLRNPEHIRDLGDHSFDKNAGGRLEKVIMKLWEVKIDGHRILAFQDRRDWVLTNGSPKINKKAFQSEIDIAVNIMAEYLNR